MNTLYYGDNLDILREHLDDESVDLVYLDPPFNSKRDYNLLFKSPKGQQSEAQITAFEDSWHWGEQAEREFDELLHQPNTDVAQMMKALRAFLGENDMMAYLTMMANRLLELHRVLKPTGSLYLHCDPTASHYLKIVLDGVFGTRGGGGFRNEVIWKRANAHNDPKMFGRISDTILYYVKTPAAKWFTQHTPYREEYYDSHFKQDATRRYFRTVPLDAPRHGAGSPGLLYEWKGKLPSASRTWAVRKKTMEEYESQGLIRYTRTGTPTLIQYADEMPGVPLQNIWTDIPPVNPQAAERLGYPTQKPLALLERIIAASSNEGDVVLDPFCGCGTATHASEKLKRQWIGIDITHLAISLIEKRLKDAFGDSCKFKVEGTPKDLASAADLAARDKYQFQWWAVSLVEAQPFQGKKKGADGGIDGLKYFYDVRDTDARSIVVSVKGGNLKADDVRALNHVREREKADIAILISLQEPSRGMKADAAAAGFFAAESGKKYARIQLLTIEGLLSGVQRAEHPDHIKHATFKRAKKETGPKKTEKTLFEADE
ncbi:restriction endonuclease subunit M [Planctomycetia bacterium]|nr:restriction endonuclease subunit M [Planctomycetia bacterium]